MRFFAQPQKCLVVSAVLLFVSAAPALAQQYMYSGNSEIGTIGDLDGSKIKSRVARTYNLQFGPAGLFADSDVYDIPSYKPFIFPLPDFGSKNDYLGVSFEEYLDQVASSYGMSLDEYLFLFQYQNVYTAETGGYVTFQQVIQVHQNDFRAGGGFLTFGEPTIPNRPQGGDGGFDPLDPVFTPLPTGDATETEADTTTTSTVNLASEIVGGGTLDVDDTGALTLSGNSVVEDSQSAANVAVVPEPATLGLLVLGSGLMLGRRRR